jgi:hypothetical protein
MPRAQKAPAGVGAPSRTGDGDSPVLLVSTLCATDGTTDRTIQVQVEIANDEGAANVPFRRTGRDLRYP